MSKKQYLSDKYSHMKERVTNPKKVIEGRNYLGLRICDRESFIEFGRKDPMFNKLWRRYKKSGGQRKKVPSIDRKNNRKGYTLDNMQFITLSENSQKDRPAKWIALENSKTGTVHRFSSTAKAAKFLNHKTRIKVTRESFYNIKTGRKFINKTKLSDRP